MHGGMGGRPHILGTGPQANTRALSSDNGLPAFSAYLERILRICRPAQL
jgi:hypothetical protein